MKVIILLENLTGKTKNLAVLGYPIAHSLSPAIQNAAIRQAGLDYVYIALPVKPENLATAISGLRAMDFRGFNVTIPHKTNIIKYLDDIDATAESVGAVNTVVNDDGKLVGYNTDVYGFMRNLREAGFDPKNKNAIVLGAGGAAKAAVQSLLMADISSVTVGARNGEKANEFIAAFSPYQNIGAFEWQSTEFESALRRADLIVNTTPLGMHPHIESRPPLNLAMLKTSALIYDVIYTPAQTRLLKDAASLGHPTLNGEDMLVWQGAEALRLWTGITPDIELMKKVLRKQL